MIVPFPCHVLFHVLFHVLSHVLFHAPSPGFCLYTHFFRDYEPVICLYTHRVHDPLLVLALTGSGTAMGIVGVLQTIPDLVLGLPAGAWADRWDRRRTIIATDLGRALLTALIPLSAMLGWDTMTVLLLVALPINALRVLFLAAWTASIPMLVGTDRIARAQGAMEAIFSVSFILGPALAGILVSVIGPVGTIGIDALSFAISAATMALVRRKLQGERTVAEQHIVREIGEGVRYLVHEPVLRDRKSTRLNSSHIPLSRMPSSA